MDLNPMPKIRGFISDSRHIFSVSYKPDMQTYKQTLKVVVIGILIIGALGYVIAEIIKLLLGF